MSTLRAMFYLLTPSDTYYKCIEDVPDCVGTVRDLLTLFLNKEGLYESIKHEHIVHDFYMRFSMPEMLWSRRLSADVMRPNQVKPVSIQPVKNLDRFNIWLHFLNIQEYRTMVYFNSV